MGPQPQSNRPHGRRAGQSAWALLPALALAAAILWIVGPALRRRMEPPAPASGQSSSERRPELEHAGFEAVTERGGAPLRVRLAPLHAAPARQAFDTQSLGRLLDLDEGMPWRLELSRGPSPDEEQSVPRLPMDVVIEDAGEGFRALPLGRLLPASPLVPLLRPRQRALGSGQADSVILWGPKTASRPRLVGWGEDLELAAATWEAVGDDEALMHLEPLR